MHKQHKLQSRDAAARRIQRAFRGWRTRRRIVHQVREDMELLVADIRRQVDGDWALLGPAATSSFLLDWGVDGKLRLPRMEDSIFGISVRFPDKEEEHDDSSVADANVDEQVASSDTEQEAANDPDEAAMIVPFESGLDSTLKNCSQSADESPAGQAVGPQEANAEIAAHEISSDTSTRDARVSAVEIRGNALQAETSAGLQAENVNRALQQTDKDGNTQLANVQEILATHSRAEILLEIEWARQALRDRRKYLRSKKRVERRPNMVLA